MKYLILCFFLISSLNNAIGQAYQIDTIQYVGHSEDFYDLVIVAEGYTVAEMELFRTDARNIPAIMAENNAYQPVMNQLNIFSISTPSEESGISLIAYDPQPTEPIQETILKNTFFGIYFRNSYRAYFLDDSIQLKTHQVLGEHIPFSDVALILTNEPIGSGRATYTGVAVAGRPKGDIWSKYVINHELAHSIGGLSDAYYAGKEEGFNKTTNSDPNSIKWKHLLDSEEVGIDSITPGVYIPNVECFMIDANPNYACPVCRARIKESIADVSKRLPTPHRVYHLETDTSAKTQTFEWDAIPGATHYEVIYHLYWRNELITACSETNQITFSLLPEDFAMTVWHPGNTDCCYGASVSIRAYNATASTYYTQYNQNISFEEMVEIPEVAAITKKSETAYHLDFIQNEALIQAILIRLYNEDGHFSEILTPQKSIDLNGLRKDGNYQFQVAAVYPDNINLNNSSPFSPLMPLAEMIDNDEDGFTTVDDCDDNNSAINPNQLEITYNGIDDDCNPATLDDDLDQDGFVLADDCDDTNSAINPNATEIANNDIDEDCDGNQLTSGTYEIANTTIKIYPNPATHYVRIDVENRLNYSAKLYDLTGKLLHTGSNISNIDLSDFPSGTYLLEILDLDAGQRIMERIVVGR